ncbi:trypsin-like [Drosophila takahashii]|uniref:trypsin-like n=1 Tax=Drosophila takahashii TaxID=29030 RepID=UPI0038996616
MLYPASLLLLVVLFCSAILKIIYDFFHETKQEEIKEVTLVDKQPEAGTKARIVGRGSYREMKWCGAGSTKRYKYTQIYDVKACAAKRKHSAPRISVTYLNICTTKKENLCSFDKGATLIIDNKLAGIMAFGDCSTEPDVFVSLFHYKDWIKNNTRD